VAATALLSAALAAALGALAVFSGRRKPERALLTAAAVGSGGGLFTATSSIQALSPAGSYGHALAFALAVGGGDSVLPFALAWCLADAAASLLSSRVLLGSRGGNAFPESYEHADGGLYSGEWGAPGRGRGGIGRAAAGGAASSSEGAATTAAATQTTTTTDAPASASKQGLGVYRYPSGARYEGQWHAGLKSGRGVYVFPKGGRYEGEWREGVPDGIGVKVLSKKKNSKDSTSTSTSPSLKAGFWRGGSFEGPLPLWQCADAAAGARTAARAARKLSLGGGGLAAALEAFSTQPLLWGVAVGWLLRFLSGEQGAGLLASLGLSSASSSSSSSTSASAAFSALLDVATKAAADAHVPLALLLSGAAAFGVVSRSSDGSSTTTLRDAFNNADAAASLGLRAASAAAATGVVAAVAAAALASTSTAAGSTPPLAAATAASTVLACSLSPAPVDLSRLAVRFRVNDAAAGSVAGWSAVTAPLLAGAAVVAVSAVTATTTTTATKSLAAVAAVAAAVSVASVTISLVARWAALSAGRRRSARAEEEAEVEMRAAAAAAPSPSSAARAAAQARAAAVAPKPGVGFDAVHENKGEEEGEKKTAKNSPFRDVEEEEEGGSEGGSGGGTGGKPAAAALAPRRLPLSRPLLPPPRRRIAPLHRRALSSPSPARLVL